MISYYNRLVKRKIPIILRFFKSYKIYVISLIFFVGIFLLTWYDLYAIIHTYPIGNGERSGPNDRAEKYLQRI